MSLNRKILLKLFCHQQPSRINVEFFVVSFRKRVTGMTCVLLFFAWTDSPANPKVGYKTWSNNLEKNTRLRSPWTTWLKFRDPEVWLRSHHGCQSYVGKSFTLLVKKYEPWAVDQFHAAKIRNSRHLTDRWKRKKKRVKGRKIDIHTSVLWR